jgi:hypothetical protein
MKPMTPYSFAFIAFRLIAFIFLLRGLYDMAFTYSAFTNPAGDLGIGIWFWRNLLFAVFPCVALYLLAHWLAKIVIWKIGE